MKLWIETQRVSFIITYLFYRFKFENISLVKDSVITNLDITLQKQASDSVPHPNN